MVFRFPLKQPDRLEKWMSAIGRKHFTATKYSKVCSDHFTRDDFKINVGGSYRLDLKNEAVPSIFDCTKDLALKRAKILNTFSNKSPIKEQPREINQLSLTPDYAAGPSKLGSSHSPILKTPSKGRVLLFSPPRKRISVKLPDTPIKKFLKNKIKLLKQTVRRKNNKIKNLSTLIESMKKNGCIDGNAEGNN